MFAPMITRRLGASLASRRVMPTVLRASMATINMPDNEKVKRNPENPEGPMLAGYTEFLDDMISKTEKMEESMDALKATYAKKQDMVLSTSDTVKWMDPTEIEALFDLAGTQKREMEEQLAAMKATLKAAHTNYAVDAPDGENDGHLEDEMEEVKHIIDDAAEFDLEEAQKKDMEEQKAAAKVTLEAVKSNYAVDAPDGENDGDLEEELEEVKHIIEDAAERNKAA